MLKKICPLFVLLLFFNTCLGQEKREIKKVSFYKGTLEKILNISKNIDNEDSYKDFVFKERKTGKEFKINELPPFSKGLFIIIQLEHLNANYNGILVDLQKDLDSFSELEPLDKAINDDNIAKKGNIVEFIEKFKDGKSKFLDKYEEYIINFTKNYKEIFSEKEVKEYLNKIKRERETLK